MKNLRLIQKSAIAAILAFSTSCSQSELAEKLNDTYALKRTFSSSWVELNLDSAYGPQIRLNEYQMGEKRIYFYYEKPTDFNYDANNKLSAKVVLAGKEILIDENGRKIE